MRLNFLALLFIFLLPAQTLLLAQDASQQTRPRRATEAKPPAIDPVSEPQVELTKLTGEPTVRIGLSTDARAVTISTTGQLLSTTSETQAPAPLSAARVRVESRALTPLPPAEASFRVEVAGAATRVDADRAAEEIRTQTGENSEVSFDAKTKTWRLLVGENLSRDDAEDLRTRIEVAGFASATIVNAQGQRADASDAASAAKNNPSLSPTPQASSRSGVRSTALTAAPTRELAVYAAGAGALFSSR
ncbi:MAG: SPOR domain-containing protein, partial [Acidobacteria bacterium]|nr:SPOR domain-containing protein [Acidobacteriota bacterium]